LNLPSRSRSALRNMSVEECRSIRLPWLIDDPGRRAPNGDDGVGSIDPVIEESTPAEPWAPTGPNPHEQFDDADLAGVIEDFPDSAVAGDGVSEDVSRTAGLFEFGAIAVQNLAEFASPKSITTRSPKRVGRRRWTNEIDERLSECGFAGLEFARISAILAAEFGEVFTIGAVKDRMCRLDVRREKKKRLGAVELAEIPELARQAQVRLRAKRSCCDGTKKLFWVYGSSGPRRTCREFNSRAKFAAARSARSAAACFI
jgi:hypothetical protein